MKSNKKLGIIFMLILWIVTAWLLYPLVVLDSVDMDSAKEYFYRSAIGIAIMIILFGKTAFDLFFPQVVSKKVPLINTIFLTLYSLLIAGGVIFMVSRMIMLYINNQESTGILF
jgi:hypothetical protein